MHLARVLLLASLLGMTVPGIRLARAKDVPAPPRYSVFDESSVLKPATTRALQSLLYEHERLTGEQVVIAIFNGLGGEDAGQWTRQVFQGWRIGLRDKDNGVLLALYWKERRARIAVGAGLEGALTDAKAAEVIDDFLMPELKLGHPDRALSLASMEILRALDSPLIQSGQAEQIIRSGDFQGSLTPGTVPAGVTSWVWVALGVLLFFVVIALLNSADAHFTGNGWYRPRPWRRASRGDGSRIAGTGGASGQW